ncbi:MAG: hypothetical protein ACH254_21370, partial [Candidatus Thiodiazotropha endolucinida]
YHWVQGQDCNPTDDAPVLGSDKEPYIVGRPRYSLGARSAGKTEIDVTVMIGWPPGSTETKVSVLVDGRGLNPDPVKLTNNVKVATKKLHKFSGKILTTEVSDLLVRTETAGTVVEVRGQDCRRIFGDDKVVPASYIKDDASVLGSDEVPY